MEFTIFDILLIPVAFIYIFGIIGIATRLKRRERISGNFARKVVHIGVGILVVAIPLLFSSYFVPFLVGCIFVCITFLTCPISPIEKFRLEAFKSGNGLGTVFYSISLTTLIFLYFEEPWLVEAGFLPLVIGDAMANLGGKRYGNHKWFFNKQKSIEGSLVGFGSTFVVLIVVFTFYELLALFPHSYTILILLATLIAIATMMVELISPFGLDNLSIPLISILIAVQF